MMERGVRASRGVPARMNEYAYEAVSSRRAQGLRAEEPDAIGASATITVNN